MNNDLDVPGWLIALVLVFAVFVSIWYVVGWRDCSQLGGAWVRGAWSYECVQRVPR